MVKNYKVTLLFLIFGLGSKQIMAQELSTQGKTFWLTFMENIGSPDNTPELKIVISCNKATSGTVKNVQTNHSVSFSIGAGGGLDTVLIKSWMGYTTGTETTSSRKMGLLLAANDTVAVSAQNTKTFSCDAALIYPIEALGVDYRIFSHLGDPATFFSNPNYRSGFAIVATEDNTSIEITPSVATRGGNNAGVKFTITLNRGESYQLQANTNKLDLSGTLVQSLNCKRIAVFGGSNRSAIGPPGSSCANSYDHLFEQLMPINLWGKKFIIAPTIWAKGRLRRYELIKVVANTNTTVVRCNNRPVKILNAGQVDTFWIDSTKCKNVLLTSNKVIGVCHYVSSEACGGTDTDPMFMWVSPVEQSLKALNFSCENAQTINKFFLNVYVKTSYRNFFLLDGATPTAPWQVITNDTSYSYLQQSGLAQGKHDIASPYGFSAMLYAYGDRGSYGYNAGASIKPLSFFMNVAGKSSSDFELDTPYYVVCQGTNIPFDVTASYIPPTGGYKWLINAPSGLVTKTSRSFSYVFTDTGMIKVRSITTRPLTGVCNGISTDTLTNFVKVFAKPKIKLLNDTTICRGNSFYLTSKTSGDTNYTFSPNTWLNCNKCFKPLSSPLMDTTYTVVATTKGCLPSRDTFKVKVRDSLLLFNSSDTTICRGTNTTLKAWSKGGLTAGHIITWDKGLGTGLSKVVAPKVTTTYRLILTDGCTKDGSKNYYADTNYIKVTVHDSLKIKMPNDTVVCEGNIVTLTPIIRGGRTATALLTWDNGLGTGPSKTITTGFQTKTYKAVLSDGCTNPKDSGYVKITVRPGLRIDTIIYNTPVCRNTVFKVKLKLSGGDSTGYRIKLLNTTLAGPPIVVDSFKNSTTPFFNIKIADDSKFKISFSQTCNGNNVPLRPFDVKIKDALKIVSTVPDDTICTGQTYDILATGSSPENLPIKFILKRKTGTSTYTPVDSMVDNANAGFKVTPTNTTPTDYIIIGDDKCNRTDTSQFRLMVRQPFSLTSLIDDELCRNQSTSFNGSVTGGKVQSITYSWTDVSNNALLGTAQSVTVAPTTSMDINLKVDDGCSVPVSDVVRLYVAPVVLNSTLAIDTAGCNPYATVFSFPTTLSQPINPSFQWVWYFNGKISASTASVGGQSPQHPTISKTYNTAGLYPNWIELQMKAGTLICDTFKQNIHVWEQPIADFDYSPKQIDIIEPLVTFTNTSTGTNSNTNYLWNFGDTLAYDNSENPLHSYKDTGEFLVTLIVTNQDGLCADTTMNIAAYRLRVLDIFRIWIPNAFSPNTDEFNTEWFPGVTSIQKLEYQIFNRWGEMVFTGNESLRWLGQYTNHPEVNCPEGIYYYHIKVRDNRKKWHYYNGTLTLLR